jgi:hypothetical protein
VHACCLAADSVAFREVTFESGGHTMHGIIMENTTCPVGPAATINMFYSHGSGRCDDAVVLRSSLPGVGLVTLVVVVVHGRSAPQKCGGQLPHGPIQVLLVAGLHPHFRVRLSGVRSCGTHCVAKRQIVLTNVTTFVQVREERREPH